MSSRSRRTLIRKVKFNIPGGPDYLLTLWDTGERGPCGRITLEYYLTQKKPRAKEFTMLFKGDNFTVGCDPTYPCIVDDLMSFLNATKEDSDKSTFKNYTAKQLEFRDKYAEDLKVEVMAWYEKQIGLNKD